MDKSSAAPGLLLIRGLGHSVSTIVDLALGAHSSIVGQRLNLPSVINDPCQPPTRRFRFSSATTRVSALPPMF